MRKKTTRQAITALIFWMVFFNTASASDKITMTIVYDNYKYVDNVTTDWGFSCLIQGTEKTILFDTGTKGSILISNMQALNLDPAIIDLVCLSHIHNDHTGGLSTILDEKKGLTVYVGASFPQSFFDNITNQGSEPVSVGEPVELCKNVCSTGELTGPIPEQGLIIDTDKGLVIIVGCAHPGVVDFVKKAKEILDKNIYLVFGGFHLYNKSDAETQQVITDLQNLGVEKCGASHCTGDHQIALIKEAFGDNYIPMGVGQVIEFPVLSSSVTDTKKSGPDGMQLNQNFPNPFNDATAINYSLINAGPVTLQILNPVGKIIENMTFSYQTPGDHHIVWQPDHVASGLYFYKLNTIDGTAIKKLLYLK